MAGEKDDEDIRTIYGVTSMLLTLVSTMDSDEQEVSGFTTGTPRLRALNSLANVLVRNTEVIAVTTDSEVVDMRILVVEETVPQEAAGPVNCAAVPNPESSEPPELALLPAGRSFWNDILQDPLVKNVPVSLADHIATVQDFLNAQSKSADETVYFRNFNIFTKYIATSSFPKAAARLRTNLSSKVLTHLRSITDTQLQEALESGSKFPSMTSDQDTQSTMLCSTIVTIQKTNLFPTLFGANVAKFLSLAQLRTAGASEPCSNMSLYSHDTCIEFHRFFIQLLHNYVAVIAQISKFSTCANSGATTAERLAQPAEAFATTHLAAQCPDLAKTSAEQAAPVLALNIPPSTTITAQELTPQFNPNASQTAGATEEVKSYLRLETERGWHLMYLLWHLAYSPILRHHLDFLNSVGLLRMKPYIPHRNSQGNKERGTSGDAEGVERINDEGDFVELEREMDTLAITTTGPTNQGKRVRQWVCLLVSHIHSTHIISSYACRTSCNVQIQHMSMKSSERGRRHDWGPALRHAIMANTGAHLVEKQYERFEKIIKDYIKSTHKEQTHGANGIVNCFVNERAVKMTGQVHCEAGLATLLQDRMESFRDKVGWLPGSKYDIGVSRLCCPLCWDLFRAFQLGDCVRGFHRVISPMELPEWVSDETAKYLLRRIQFKLYFRLDRVSKLLRFASPARGRGWV